MGTNFIFPLGLCLLLLPACSSADDDRAPAVSNGGGVSADAPAPMPPGDPVSLQTSPEGYPTPDTTMRGRFEVRRGCLTFVTPAAVLRAVLPSGSRFDPPATVALPAGKGIQLGETVVVKGGEGEFRPPAAVPANCPERAMLVGGVM